MTAIGSPVGLLNYMKLPLDRRALPFQWEIKNILSLLLKDSIFIPNPNGLVIKPKEKQISNSNCQVYQNGNSQVIVLPNSSKSVSDNDFFNPFAIGYRTSQNSKKDYFKITTITAQDDYVRLDQTNITTDFGYNTLNHIDVIHSFQLYAKEDIVAIEKIALNRGFTLEQLYNPKDDLISVFSDEYHIWPVFNKLFEGGRTVANHGKTDTINMITGTTPKASIPRVKEYNLAGNYKFLQPNNFYTSPQETIIGSINKYLDTLITEFQEHKMPIKKVRV